MSLMTFSWIFLDSKFHKKLMINTIDLYFTSTLESLLNYFHLMINIWFNKFIFLLCIFFKLIQNFVKILLDYTLLLLILHGHKHRKPFCSFHLLLFNRIFCKTVIMLMLILLLILLFIWIANTELFFTLSNYF